MRDFRDNSLTLVFFAVVLSLCVSVSAKCYAGINDVLSKEDNVVTAKVEVPKEFKLPDGVYDRKNAIVHKRVRRWLHGRPAIVNILIIDPKKSGYIVKPSFGSYFIDNLKGVRDIVSRETAFAGINASYFKPDSGAPLGTSIVDGKIVTGPLFRRVTFGMTKDLDFKMSRIDINGEVRIGDNLKFDLFNLNQPVFSKYSFTVFTDKWGRRTPRTSHNYSHIVVQGDRIQYIKNSSVAIPKGGYVLVGPHYRIAGLVQKDDRVSYRAKLSPDDWNDVEYAVGGGPYLVRKGNVYIDRQNFSRRFLWTKAPRTAIGYTKGGSLIMVTIDGRRRGFSEGATMSELARIMWEQGAYYAMNLDGGTSTQMVVDGKLVNYPTVRGGSRVANALVIVAPAFAAE